jgi:hypothetical protein
MRKLRIFIVELVLVAAIVGWLLGKVPDAFDPLMPWIITAVGLHLFYECFWQSEFVTGWRQLNFKTRNREKITLALANVILAFLLWFGARGTLEKAVDAYSHPVPPPPLPHPPAPPAAYYQQSEGSQCANVLAAGGVNMNCTQESDRDQNKPKANP